MYDILPIWNCLGHIRFLHECTQVNCDLAVYFIFSIQLGQNFVGVSWGQVDTHVVHETVHMFIDEL